MNLELQILIVAILLMCFVIMIILKLNLSQLQKKRKSKMTDNNNARFYEVIMGKYTGKKNNKFIENYMTLKQSIELTYEQKIKIEEAMDFKALEQDNQKKIKSVFKLRRIEAAVNLSIISTERARIIIENAILKEKDYPVKLYMANAISDMKNKKSLPVLVKTLINSHKWYRDKVNALIFSYDEDFYEYIPEIIDSEYDEIKELIVQFGSIYISEYLKSYLLNVVETFDDRLTELGASYEITKKGTCYSCVYGKKILPSSERLCLKKGVVSSEYSCLSYKLYPSSLRKVQNCKNIVYMAMEALAKNYFTEIYDKKYIFHKDPGIRNIAIKSLSNYNSSETLDCLLSFLGEKSTYEALIDAVLARLNKNPLEINIIFERYFELSNQEAKLHIAEILSNKIEYILMKLKTDKREKTLIILKDILAVGKISQFIWFMNKNRDLDVENDMVYVVKQVIKERPELSGEFNKYLSYDLAVKCSVQKDEVTIRNRSLREDKKFVRDMTVFTAINFLTFPLIYVIRHSALLFKLDFEQHLHNFIVDFNYYLIYYSLTINVIYITLLIISKYRADRQVKLWKLKSETMIFKDKMLPSVSIIAPAYNEEKTIIESANSLLNLKYPDYELIFVNDGSKDKTLNLLISNFNLGRVDINYGSRMNTTPIRGIYVNPSIPKLIVLDKENGGKADSLNAGINISTREYFCGIDADSMLEEDALLKLASQTLDIGVEAPALGGNVMPINGCSVENGVIADIRIPQNAAARLQTVEYIRAFMTGRLGWDGINCLMIVSGAFGLFRKERIISIGGYLTANEKYAKDTVGEDIEMIVRTRRLMSEMGLKYKIAFSFDANCWTQVPEDMKSLRKQRQRWGRGLADTLMYHKKLIFNPKYGRTGLIAMPYFLIFELAGPMIELQGYIAVVIAFILGFLNIQIALLLFIVTIFMGGLVSVTSLLILEKGKIVFKTKDIMKLLFYAIIENFGYRQLSVIWRAIGILRILKLNEGWGTIERKNFNKY